MYNNNIVLPFNVVFSFNPFTLSINERYWFGSSDLFGLKCIYEGGWYFEITALRHSQNFTQLFQLKRNLSRFSTHFLENKRKINFELKYFRVYNISKLK